MFLAGWPEGARFARTYFVKSLLIFLLSALVAVGCSSSEDEVPHTNGNGVNDVKTACTIRNGWANASASKCLNCFALSKLPLCDCQDDNPEAARCSAQAEAKRTEADCTKEVSDCVSACGSDCACVDACYSAHTACKSVSAALDGCVADVCAPSCK